MLILRRIEMINEINNFDETDSFCTMDFRAPTTGVSAGVDFDNERTDQSILNFLKELMSLVFKY